MRRPADGGWWRVVGTPVTLREGVGVKLVATVRTRHETETWCGRRSGPSAARRCWPSRSTRPTSRSRLGDLKKGRLLRLAGRRAAGDVAVAAHDRPRGRALDLDDPDVVRLFIATGLAGDSGRIRAPHADRLCSTTSSCCARSPRCRATGR